MFPHFAVDLTKSLHGIVVFRAASRQILLLCLLCSATAFAQYNPYRFDHWTTDNGLPQNTVRAIVQTRDGYLWMTTYDGLARFDGVRFTVFDKGNTKGINTNRFVGLFEADDGSLLIGTQGSGFTVYQNGRFNTYTTADGLPSDQILGIFSDPNGTPVINTSKGPVYLRGGKILLAPPQYQNRQFYRAPSGTLVTIEASGVKQVKGGRVTYYPLELSAKNFNNQSAKEDSRGNLWLADGPNLSLLRDGQITRFPKVESLHSVCEDAEGGFWFAGIIDAKGGDNSPARFKDGRFTKFSEADGILEAQVNAIISDREGSIWLATARGLYRARKRFLTAYSTESGLMNHEIYPLMQSRDGSIWVGSAHGLNQVHFRDGKFESSAIVTGTTIQALWEDAAGRIWIGALAGLRRYENGKIQDLSALVNKATVHDVKADREGKYWVATSKGLFELNGDNPVAHYTTKDGLPGDDVNIIRQDRRGALWFGTQGGLARLKDGKFTSYTVAEGLVGAQVRTIYEDAEGTLWIGTYDDGLSRLRDGKFFNYRTEHGLYNNGVFQILEDRRGYFWISCNKGIYRVSRRELDEMAEGRISRINSVAFGKDDGMLNTECNGGRQPAGFVAEDGKLWFPTMGGVVVVDPEAAPVNSQPPPVLIESVTLERGLVDFSQGVMVAPGRRELEINYTGLSLIRSEQVKFRYKLEGLDTDWVDVGTRRVAYFPYLSPGSYTFHVNAANSDGVWNNEGAALRIVVEAPFYLTAWFITLVVLGAAAVGYLAYRSRIAQMQRRQEEQEAFSRRLIESQEGERKRIAAELHDGLGQSLLVIKNRALVGGMSPEDARVSKEQFDEISLATSQAIEEARRIAYDLRPYHLDRLGLTQSIEEMVERIAALTPARFTVNIPLLDGVFTKEGEAIFYRIVQESLTNIIKHSQATEALVAIRREEDSITLTVRDNGKGFSVAHSGSRSADHGLKKSAGGAGPRNLQAVGFGLIGLAERVRMLDGVYTLETAPNQGTAITVKFPVR